MVDLNLRKKDLTWCNHKIRLHRRRDSLAAERFEWITVQWCKFSWGATIFEIDKGPTWNQLVTLGWSWAQVDPGKPCSGSFTTQTGPTWGQVAPCWTPVGPKLGPCWPKLTPSWEPFRQIGVWAVLVAKRLEYHETLGFQLQTRRFKHSWHGNLNDKTRDLRIIQYHAADGQQIPVYFRDHRSMGDEHPWQSSKVLLWIARSQGFVWHLFFGDSINKNWVYSLELWAIFGG